MNKKKINVIFPYNSVGGAFRSTYEISNRLTEIGYEVTVYFPFFAPFEGKSIFSLEGFFLFVRGIIRSLVRRNKITWFETCFRIRQVPLIHRRFIADADIIIANHWQTASKVYNLPLSKGEKYYFIRDVEQWAEYYPNEIEAFKLDMKRLVVAPWIEEFLDKELNLGVEAVITNGFNFQKFHVSNKDFLKKDITLSMIYSSHPMKGFEDAKLVFSRIKELYPNIKILLFGFEPEPKNLGFNFEYIRGAAGDEVKEIYKKTDIFFCPSLQEGFHNPPSEAMASKCAVLATAVGSVPFTMNNLENGIIVKPGDTNGMIQGLIKLIEDRSLRVELSKNANQSIKDLTWDKSIEKLDGLFSNQ